MIRCYDGLIHQHVSDIGHILNCLQHRLLAYYEYGRTFSFWNVNEELRFS